MILKNHLTILEQPEISRLGQLICYGLLKFIFLIINASFPIKSLLCGGKCWQQKNLFNPEETLSIKA